MLVGGRLRGTRGHPVHDATGALLGYAAVAGPGDVAEAVAAAKAALPGWAAMTADERGRALHGVAELLDERRDRLAADLAAADGIAVDAAAELVDAAVDRWVWYAGWTDKIAGILGAVHPTSGPYVGWSAPRPVGVVGAVSPPSLSALVEALAPVLAAGAAAVVVAPHERPVAAAALAEVLATAELPAGAANVLTGPVGDLATRLTGVDGLDLTGAPDVVAAAAGRGTRVLAPPMIDDPPLHRLRAWSEVTTVWHPVGR
ncbi:MAG: aldehyde dehydrogenase family protein [Pseudonocardia sp.]|nr:aldehyde dehydrogenase family protein [Pseudonocardia sp.]